MRLSSLCFSGSQGGTRLSQSSFLWQTVAGRCSEDLWTVCPSAVRLSFPKSDWSFAPSTSGRNMLIFFKWNDLILINGTSFWKVGWKWPMALKTQLCPGPSSLGHPDYTSSIQPHAFCQEWPSLLPSSLPRMVPFRDILSNSQMPSQGRMSTGEERTSLC